MKIYLSENIKRLRRERDVTQETLAQFLGVSFQSVSKWERGESYPDMTMLPEIAGFFGVSTDELLGVNRAAAEEELTALLEEHDNLIDDELIRQSINSLTEKYPGDFRVQLRLMGYLVFYNNTDSRSKILSIYEKIQKYCTDDSVRICAKRYYISYLQILSSRKNSGVTFKDYEKIIKEMPRMRDGQEVYALSYLAHKRPEAYEVMMEALEEQIFLLYEAMSDFYFCCDRFPREYQLDIVEKTTAFFEYIYDDGNYGRMWRVVINCCYGILGWFYHDKGDYEKALGSFRKSAELAVKFDSLDRVTTLHSTLFEGKTFDKNSLGIGFSAKKWMKEQLSVGFPLSDEFKSSAEFKEIVKLLD